VGDEPEIAETPARVNELIEPDALHLANISSPKTSNITSLFLKMPLSGICYPIYILECTAC